MKTSRILNEQVGLFGLGVFDLVILGYALILSHTLLSQFNLEIFAFIITGLLFFVLIHLRLTQRRKTIRDFFKFYFFKATAKWRYYV